MSRNNDNGSDETEGIIVFSPNQRLARLRRLLAKPPSKAVTLMLFVVSANPFMLAQWERADIVPGLAPEIESIMAEHAEEEHSETNFTLTYMSAEGNALSTTKWSVKKPLTVMPDEAEAIALGLDGTATGQIAQAQKHLEGMARLYFMTHQQQLNMAHKLTEQALMLVKLQDERVLSAHTRIRELEDANSELAGTYKVGEEGSADPNHELSELQRRGLDLVEKAVERVAPALQVWIAREMQAAAARAAGRGTV